MSGEGLPKRFVFGNLEGAVRRGWGGKEKEWTECVQSHVQVFTIAGGLESDGIGSRGLG